MTPESKPVLTDLSEMLHYAHEHGEPQHPGHGAGTTLCLSCRPHPRIFCPVLTFYTFLFLIIETSIYSEFTYALKLFQILQRLLMCLEKQHGPGISPIPLLELKLSGNEMTENFFSVLLLGSERELTCTYYQICTRFPEG